MFILHACIYVHGTTDTKLRSIFSKYVLKNYACIFLTIQFLNMCVIMFFKVQKSSGCLQIFICI